MRVRQVLRMSEDFIAPLEIVGVGESNPSLEGANP